MPLSEQPNTRARAGAGAGTPPPGLGAARLARLAAALETPDGGFTVNATTGAPARRGYAVSVHPRCERVYPAPLSAATLDAYLTQARGTLALPGRMLGGWHDPATGRVHLDVSIVVPGLRAAFALARAAGQRAVFHLDAAVSLPVPAHQPARPCGDGGGCYRRRVRLGGMPQRPPEPAGPNEPPEPTEPSGPGSSSARGSGAERASARRARRGGSRAPGAGRAGGCGATGWVPGELSERDRAWIEETVGALPPPTEEEIVGWCDIISHARTQRRATGRDSTAEDSTAEDSTGGGAGGS